MTRGVVSISPEEDLPRAAKVMADKNINRLPVLDSDKKLVGIITRGDVIGAI
ncbi:MAG: CBS domain-containing protein [Candidatus Hydrothermarchaeaceae archaeon]